MNAQEIFQCLTPELALAGFADGDPEYDRDEDAFHAYCASYLLCKKYGIDTQAYDFRYAPDFFEGMEPQEVRAELSKARDAANQISSRMAKVFEQNRMSQRQQEQTGQRQEGDRTGRTDRKEKAARTGRICRAGNPDSHGETGSAGRRHRNDRTEV